MRPKTEKKGERFLKILVLREKQDGACQDKRNYLEKKKNDAERFGK